MYQIINVTTDSVCILFTLMVILYLHTCSDRSEKLNRLFVWICICNAGMLLGDLPNWLCEGFAKPWYPFVLWIGCFIQYLSGILIALNYTWYLHTYLSRQATLKGYTLPVIHLLCALDLLLILLNLWNGKFYYIDANNYYHRGEWYWLSQIIPILILLIDASVILYHRRSLKHKEVFAFLGYLMFPLIGILIQMQMYGIAITYLTSSIAMFIIFLCIQSEQRLVAEQQKNDLDKANALIMLSQIKPHFIGNSLISIKHLYEQNPKMASDAMDHFIYYIRENLYSLTDNTLISFQKELNHVKDYLYLEQLRFDERLHVEWDIQYTDYQLPPLSLQPIVENAVRHGITQKTEGGTLIIRSEKEGNYAIITVTDTGAGFDPSQVPNSSRPHIGLNNVRKRLAMQCNGSLEITSYPGIGTTVRILLPFSDNPLATPPDTF